MTAKEGGLPGGDSEMFKELEMQVCYPLACKFQVKFKFLNFVIFKINFIQYKEFQEYSQNATVGDYL